jgi:hypothetical protein
MSDSPLRDAGTAFARIEAMEKAILSGDRSAAARYLDPAIRYRIGARETLIGIEAVFQAIEHQSTMAIWTGHSLAGFWLVEDTLIVEVISHFKRVQDGRAISFPCTDIYRFRNGLVADWRVFADMSPFSDP